MIGIDIVSDAFNERRNALLQTIEKSIKDFYDERSRLVNTTYKFIEDLSDLLKLNYPNYDIVVYDIENDHEMQTQFFEVEIIIDSKKYKCKFDIV